VISALGLVAAVGLGRSGFGPGMGFQPRYALLVFPLLAAVYYAWGLYAPPAAGRLVQNMLFVAAAGSFLFNSAEGRAYGRVRRQATDAFMADLHAGAPVRRLAAKHWTAFYPGRRDVLHGLGMLERAGQGPFRRTKLDGAPGRTPASVSTDPGEASGASPPPGCRFERPVSIAPLALHDMRWTDGVGHGWGNDPYLVLGLPPASRFCGVRLALAIQTGDGLDAGLQFFWARSGLQEFTGTERNWRAWVPSAPEVTTLFVPVSAPADVLRIDPDVGPVELQLVSVVLLQWDPAAGPAPVSASP
jgi:hypothetical protein